MQKRLTKLREALSRTGAEAILVSSASNMRYLTGFDNPDGALLITEDGAYAFQDFRYAEVAERKLSGLYEIRDPRDGALKQINDILKSKKIKSLSYESGHVSVDRYELMQRVVEATLKSAGGIIEELRAVKDEREIESIRRAQEIADTAYSQLLKMLTPNMTEADIACELEYIMRKNGAEDKSFDTIAVSGPSSSLPHGVPSNVKLRRGFLTMDFGAVVDGYHSDMTRTVCIGGADGDMKRLYGTVLTAQESALDFIRAGVKCSDCDRVARDIIDADYKGCFGHSLGHGVGLDIHESPTLSQKCDRLLTAGNVVTVEPGIYINGKYGCRIEDFVLVGENSAENFVKSPKELIEIL